MARVNGPLLSIKASGNIDKTIVFSYSRGINIVKWFKKSPDAQTVQQTFQRGLFYDAKEEWNKLTSEQRAEYNARAYGRFFTGYNLFISEYIYFNKDDNYLDNTYLLSRCFGFNSGLLNNVYVGKYLLNM